MDIELDEVAFMSNTVYTHKDAIKQKSIKKLKLSGLPKGQLCMKWIGKGHFIYAAKPVIELPPTKHTPGCVLHANMPPTTGLVINPEKLHRWTQHGIIEEDVLATIPLDRLILSSCGTMLYAMLPKQGQIFQYCISTKTKVKSLEIESIEAAMPKLEVPFGEMANLKGRDMCNLIFDPKFQMYQQFQLMPMYTLVHEWNQTIYLLRKDNDLFSVSFSDGEVRTLENPMKRSTPDQQIDLFYDMRTTDSPSSKNRLNDLAHLLSRIPLVSHQSWDHFYLIVSGRPAFSYSNKYFTKLFKIDYATGEISCHDITAYKRNNGMRCVRGFGLKDRIVLLDRRGGGLNPTLFLYDMAGLKDLDKLDMRLHVPQTIYMNKEFGPVLLGTTSYFLVEIEERLAKGRLVFVRVAGDRFHKVSVVIGMPIGLRKWVDSIAVCRSKLIIDLNPKNRGENNTYVEIKLMLS